MRGCLSKAPKLLDLHAVSLIVAFLGVSRARHMDEWSADLMYLVQ